MSYFDNPAEFLGEMPLPEPIGDSDPGVLALKANADHAHGLILGGINTTWFALILTINANNFGSPFRPAEYTTLGNVGFIRGLVAVTGAVSYPVSLGSIPVSIAPKSREVGMGYGFGGPYRIDLQPDGVLALQSSAGSVNPGFLSLGTPYFIWCMD